MKNNVTNSQKAIKSKEEETRDTIVVSAHEDGFEAVFLRKNCWYAVKIGQAWLSRIKFIAVYRTRPISAVTHFAPVDRIEPYAYKYCLFFKEPAKKLNHPIPLGDAGSTTMMSPRYTSFLKLMSSKNLTDLFEIPKPVMTESGREGSNKGQS